MFHRMWSRWRALSWQHRHISLGPRPFPAAASAAVQTNRFLHIYAGYRVGRKRRRIFSMRWEGEERYPPYPARMISSPAVTRADTSVLDSDERLVDIHNWKEIFPPAAYASPWEFRTVAGNDVGNDDQENASDGSDKKDPPDDSNKNEGITTAWEMGRWGLLDDSDLGDTPANMSSRHVLQLLQELYQVGHPLSQDRITTARCHGALRRLLLRAQPSISRARRALAVVSAMELFYEFSDNDESNPTDEMLVDQSILGRSGHDAKSSQFQPSWSTRIPQFNRSSKKSKKGRLPMEIPIPNRGTYQWVLQILADTPGPRSIAEEARRVVQRMMDRFQHKHDLGMKPNAFHYNCILQAWKVCNDPERAALAMHDLLHQEQLGQAEVFSYTTLLLVCGYSLPSEKAGIVGAHVAVKLWQHLFEGQRQQPLSTMVAHTRVADTIGATPELSDDERSRTPLHFPSHFYGHFLQAIRWLPAGKLRSTYFDACFARACEHGKVNFIVLEEFLVHSRDPQLFTKYLGPFRERIYGLSAKQAVETLLRDESQGGIPASWRYQADPVDNRKDKNHEDDHKGIMN